MFRSQVVFIGENGSPGPDRFDLAYPPSVETAAWARQATREIFARAANFTRALVFTCDEAEITRLSHVVVRLRKLMPNARMILHAPSPGVFNAIRALRQGIFDLVIREQSIEDWLAQPADSSKVRTLSRGSDGMILSKQSPDTSVDGGRDRVLLVMMPAFDNSMPPLGLASLAASLRSAGVEVESLDLNCVFWNRLGSREDRPSGYENVILWSDPRRYASEGRPLLDQTFRELREAIQSGRYSSVGFSLFQTNLLASVDAFRQIRETGSPIKIFSGGPSCSTEWADQQLSRGLIDAAVFGEGEVSVVELMRSWSRGEIRPLAGVHQAAPGGEILRGESRPLAKLDELPPADFAGFPIYNYSRFQLPVSFSRGCVAKCSFCSESAYWKKFRILSTERIVDSFRKAVETHGVSFFEVNDSLMNGSHSVLEGVADELIRSGTRVYYQGFCRLDPRLTPELLRKLKRSGCTTISFGLESASQKVLDSMKKGVDARNYERIIRDTHGAGINCVLCVMVGFPGETWWDYLQTVFLLVRFRRQIHDINLSIFTPSEGSPIEAQFQRRELVVEENRSRFWSTTDGKNTFGVRYVRYKLLKTLWAWMKRRPVSPAGWNYEYSSITLRPRPGT